MIGLLNGFRRVRYASGNTKFAADGNSLMAGAGSTGGQTLPVQLAALSPVTIVGGSIANVGVSAQSSRNMNGLENDGSPGTGTNVATDIQAQYDGGKANNILLAWEVTNSLYFDRTVRQAVDDFWAYCDARRGEGWKVVVLNTIPRYQNAAGGIATYNQKLIDANALLLAEWRSHANAHVDLRAPGSPFAFTSFNEADFTGSGVYDPDNIHGNNAGYAYGAAQCAAALLRVRA
ncbi:MAG: hypothetical protein WCS09_02825 [Pseudomonadota bacterium]|jgi:hypothetical protein